MDRKNDRRKEDNNVFGAFDREKDRRRRKLNKDKNKRSKKWRDFIDDEDDDAEPDIYFSHNR